MNDPAQMTVSIIWAVVVGGSLMAALAARRLPIGRTIRMASAWIVIFALVYAVSLFRHDLSAVWQRARDDVSGTRSATVVGQETIVRRDDDGHYRITGRINGRDLTFLIDTGASVTVIDRTDADRIGLTINPAMPRQRMITAGGEIAVEVANPVTLDIGSIRRTGFVPWVGGATDGTNVLGVDWLNQLSSWRVEGGSLYLVP
jgi:aspartyl protease family protein